MSGPGRFDQVIVRSSWAEGGWVSIFVFEVRKFLQEHCQKEKPLGACLKRGLTRCRPRKLGCTFTHYILKVRKTLCTAINVFPTDTNNISVYATICNCDWVSV